MDLSAGTVTGRETVVEGGVTATLLHVQFTDFPDVQSVQLIGQAGEESNPPDGSLVVALALGEGTKVAVATNDGVAPELAPGAKRIYSVADGAVAAQILLEPDGTVRVGNMAASFTMSPEGVFTFTGAVVVTGDVVANGVSLMTHAHSGVTPGSGSTGVPVP
jgi:hypothetical protein